VLERAREILKFLEKHSTSGPRFARRPDPEKGQDRPGLQNSLLPHCRTRCWKELRKVDLDELQPEAALELLKRLRDLSRE